MKPAARDQDIPRGAGSGAPEASETPGGAHRAERKARRARQRENHRSDPPSRLPTPPPPGASTNAAGARFSWTDSTAAPSKSPRSKHSAKRLPGSRLSTASVPDPRARLPASFSSFLPSLLCSRPRAPPPALRLRLRRPRLRPLPIPRRPHAHASTYAARQPEAPPSARVQLCLLDRRNTEPHSWFVLRLVSFAVRVNQSGIRLGKLGEGGGLKPAKAGLLGGWTKCE